MCTYALRIHLARPFAVNKYGFVCISCGVCGDCLLFRYNYHYFKDPFCRRVARVRVNVAVFFKSTVSE